MKIFLAYQEAIPLKPIINWLKQFAEVRIVMPDQIEELEGDHGILVLPSPLQVGAPLIMNNAVKVNGPALDNYLFQCFLQLNDRGNKIPTIFLGAIASLYVDFMQLGTLKSCSYEEPLLMCSSYNGELFFENMNIFKEDFFVIESLGTALSPISHLCEKKFYKNEESYLKRSLGMFGWSLEAFKHYGICSNPWVRYNIGGKYDRGLPLANAIIVDLLNPDNLQKVSVENPKPPPTPLRGSKVITDDNTSLN